ncbi:hypothetical protein TNCV_869531 [Trichonephila clavipes]|nr:hypothetical protein TNCV_869531 [Trichonephila clavipes]
MVPSRGHSKNVPAENAHLNSPSQRCVREECIFAPPVTKGTVVISDDKSKYLKLNHLKLILPTLPYLARLTFSVSCDRTAREAVVFRSLLALLNEHGEIRGLYEWHRRFKEVQESIEDNECVGRSSTSRKMLRLSLNVFEKFVARHKHKLMRLHA